MNMLQYSPSGDRVEITRRNVCRRKRAPIDSEIFDRSGISSYFQALDLPSFRSHEPWEVAIGAADIQKLWFVYRLSDIV